MRSNTIDRSALDGGMPKRSWPEASVVWFWLAIVGIVLMLVGWFRAAFG